VPYPTACTAACITVQAMIETSEVSICTHYEDMKGDAKCKNKVKYDTIQQKHL